MIVWNSIRVTSTKSPSISRSNNVIVVCTDGPAIGRSSSQSPSGAKGPRRRRSKHRSTNPLECPVKVVATGCCRRAADHHLLGHPTTVAVRTARNHLTFVLFVTVSCRQEYPKTKGGKSCAATPPSRVVRFRRLAEFARGSGYSSHTGNGTEKRRMFYPTEPRTLVRATRVAQAEAYGSPTWYHRETVHSFCVST